MADCDPNTTVLPCWACKDPWELETAMIVFLCRWQNGETGGSCDPQTVLSQGACYACLTPLQRLAMMVGLLCNIANAAPPPPEAGIIYWGGADSAAFDANSMYLWDDATFTSLLAGMQQETGPYRSSGYSFVTSGTPAELFFYFIVPDSYASPLATSGFKFNYGVSATPLRNVLPYPVDTLLQNDAGLSNWPLTSSAVNGWGYQLHNISGVAYRWYPFALHINYPMVLATPSGPASISRSRAGNVVTLNISGAITTTTIFASSISGAGVASFNDPNVVSSYIDDTHFSYTNTGPNVGVTADVNIVYTLYDRQDFPWVPGINVELAVPSCPSTATLFITT